jgi:biotin/methionine sulfoxide reductase
MNDIDAAVSPRIRGVPHSSHWGAFSVLVRDGKIEVAPHPRDTDPSPLLGNIPASVSHRARIAEPMVRRGWLERGPGADPRRGRETFLPISWPGALDLVAAELRRVRAVHGPHAIFGGSYGWSSAGRFHHAQSQIHRFLNAAGGYVRSVNSYSSGAATVILPHILGTQEAVAGNNVSWAELAAQSGLVLAFGGMALKNNNVGGGGTSEHIARARLRAAHRRGAEFHLISPIRDDLAADIEVVWHPIRPGTDVALMLGMAHTLVAERRHDRAFLDRFCVGYEAFEAYLLGRSDSQPKDAVWAAAICGLAADEIIGLARRTAGRRTLVTCSRSLQRAEHGEQPVWMGVVLAALLGQIGLPGGGFAYALGSTSNTGKPPLAVPIPTLPQGRNSISDFIPVARVADMLLRPGEPFDYNGQRLTYPDIKLVYWAGGNPFHHHQDLNNLRDAFARPDTVILHDSAWTASARHADIVLPATVTLEREDIGASAGDPLLVAMHRAVAPRGQARDDYDIFAELAQRLGIVDRFTEGRSARQWLQHLYEPTRRALLAAASMRPISTSSGKSVSWSCRPCRGTAGSSVHFAAIPTRRRCRRRAARWRSRPRRSRGSATRIARDTLSGCRPARARARPPRRASRCSSSPTSRQPACTVSWILALSAWYRRSKGGSRSASIRRMPRRGASATATSCGCSMTGGHASPVRC